MQGWAIAADERRAASGDQHALIGYVSGWMHVAAGAVGLLRLAVPALRFHPTWQLSLGLAAQADEASAAEARNRALSADASRSLPADHCQPITRKRIAISHNADGRL